LREEGFDFVFDRHSGLEASVEVGGGGWQTSGYPGVGGLLRKVFEGNGLGLDLLCKVFILLGMMCKVLI
jgi:hypothetical protein